jgi:hypothetical protein
MKSEQYIGNKLVTDINKHAKTEKTGTARVYRWLHPNQSINAADSAILNGTLESLLRCRTGGVAGITRSRDTNDKWRYNIPVT